MEIAIMNQDSATVSLHTLPQWVQKDEDIIDYVCLTLEKLGKLEDMIVADKIIIDDFRIKS